MHRTKCGVEIAQSGKVIHDVKQRADHPYRPGERERAHVLLQKLHMPV